MDDCSPESPDSWYNHLEGAFAMSVGMCLVTVIANKIHNGSLYGLIISTFTSWGLYYASYYSKKRPTYPCYHAKLQGWIPEIYWHRSFYAHAHPFLYGFAIAAGLACGDMIDKYNVHIHYTKGGVRKKSSKDNCSSNEP